MRLVSILAAAFVMLAAAPAMAQEAPASPAMAAAQTDLEAAGEAIEPVLAAMSEQAATIRADTALTEADKRARIEALIAENQIAIDAFAEALTQFVAAQAQAEGSTAEEAAAVAAMFPGLLRQQLTESLITGEDAD